jgi:Carbohydrate family 9 binding domain-like/Domain of unknown function (DUF5916)
MSKFFGSRWARAGLIVVTLLGCLLDEVVRAEESESPHVFAVLVDEPPIIDGVLDDAAWAKAEVIERFTQVEPATGAEPTFRTEVRILTDGEMLYIAFRGYDDEPEKIVANRMSRDEFFFFDDNLLVVIDPFHNKRTGYFFNLNPVGGRRDGTIEGDVSEGNWNGIWYGDAQIDAEGWTGEMAIPFKTLSLRPGADVWGLNLIRRIRRFNEEDRWADPTLERLSINLSRAGTLTGMSVADQGVGLDVVPSMTVGYTHDEEANRDKLRTEPSFDAFYRIVPGVTASVTANTDFAQTEVDDAQVTISRFELFFPEKRSFFLQDTGIFDFGGLREENGIPFFSRRIGLDSNLDSVRLLGGGKVSGRTGRFNVGLLSIQQDRNQGIDDQNLSVARISAEVFDGSTIGMILTHGDPLSEDNNLLVGGDFNLRSNRIVDGRYVTGSLWLQESFSEEPGREYGSRSTGWGGEVAYPNDKVNWRFTFKDFQSGFDPALGFVNRTDIRFYEGNYRFRIRSASNLIRTIDIRANPEVVTDRDDEIQTANLRFYPLRFTTQIDDVLEFFAYHSYDSIPAPFFLVPHIGIPAGTYTTQGGYVLLDTSQARHLRLTLRVGYGTLYDGEILRVRGALEWRPSPHWLFAAEYDERQIWGVQACHGGTAAALNCSQVGGPTVVRRASFGLRLARVRVRINFNPDISWSTIVQYENVTDNLSAQSRLRWIIEPGREFFFIFGQDFDASPDSFRVGETGLIGKLSWTFRF